MGRSKALMPFAGRPLAAHVAGILAPLAATVEVIGDPSISGDLGLPVIQDVIPGLGPLGGIITALTRTPADWNVVAACDMPALSRPFVLSLMDRAEGSDAACVIPRGPSGRLEPLCAAYRRHCLAHFSEAAERGVRKMREALQGLTVEIWHVDQSEPLLNVNTPAQWNDFLKRETRQDSE